MSTPAITPQVTSVPRSGGSPDYAALAAQSGAISSTPAPQQTTPTQSVNADGSPNYDAIAAQNGAITANTPGDTGEITNDVGNTVIVPKDGESFSDTMARAVQHGKTLVDTKTGNLTPEGEKEFNAEEKTMPKKVAETLGAAAGIGVAGPATLAAAGELGSMAPEAYEALKTFAQTPAGKKALTYVLHGALGAAGFRGGSAILKDLLGD